MKKTTWQKHHKWLGIIFCFFMLIFCLSGVVLNHRTIVADINVGRKWLPDRYRFTAWNGGLLRGTVPYTDEDSANCVLMYGNGGIWKTDSAASCFSDFNKGLPDGADFQQIKNVVQTADRELFAISIFGLYRYTDMDTGWQTVSLPEEENGLLTDVFWRNDTLIVATRSHLYIAAAPYATFTKIQLKAPEDYREEVSLFRTMWMLHSGELFGTTGRIIADIIAIVLIVLCVSGLAYWLLSGYIRRKRLKGEKASRAVKLTRASFMWHDKIGRTTIAFTIFIAVTGWCLRPPLMIPLALTKVPVSGTNNPWHDKLRMVRFDDNSGDWLLSTSEGFYSLKSWNDTPEKIDHTPPVSVMGLNVFQKDNSGKWLCGSFSGMFVWDRQRHTVTDYFTQQPATEITGPPFGKHAVSGYSRDLADSAFVVEYYKGTKAVPQPAELELLPMSLWNVALEAHSGRIFIGSAATYIFVFFAGIGAVWCLWSGWQIRKQKHRGSHR